MAPIAGRPDPVTSSPRLPSAAEAAGPGPARPARHRGKALPAGLGRRSQGGRRSKRSGGRRAALPGRRQEGSESGAPNSPLRTHLDMLVTRLTGISWIPLAVLGHLVTQSFLYPSISCLLWNQPLGIKQGRRNLTSSETALEIWSMNLSCFPRGREPRINKTNHEIIKAEVKGVKQGSCRGARNKTSLEVPACLQTNPL